MNKTIAIAIDGPAAAGKSTVAKIVANKLTYVYIDTGAMYRALTLEAINKNIELNDEALLTQLLSEIKIELEQTSNGQSVLTNGVDVTLAIRSQEVTNSVSHVAKHQCVRNKMVIRQQGLAKKKSVVMDGRDIGTQVLPDADIKFFLIASVEVRAKRRYDENIKNGIFTSLKELKKEIEARDSMDSKREIAPLIKASDAIEIDTTLLSINEVVEYMLSKVDELVYD